MLFRSNHSKLLNSASSINLETKVYIKNVIGNYVPSLDDMLAKRKAIFDFGIERFSKLGFTERFVRSCFEVPSVMMLKNNLIVNNLNFLKTALLSHGIQSSIFYGEDAFFIPSHQNLEEDDISYFETVLKSLINNKI